MIGWLKKRLFKPKLKGQMGNTIKILEPWRNGNPDGPGIWAFDDNTCGLRGEPFVTDASLLIDRLVEFFNAKPDKEGKIRLMFSHIKFPGSLELVLIEDSNGGGVTYYSSDFKQEAWLCPAFYNYFDKNNVPTMLYAKAA